MDLDIYKIVESSQTRKGLSITFIVAGILLLLSNLGIDIKFAGISINSILPPNYLAGVQIYIIINLFSLAATILNQDKLTKPKMVVDKVISTTCFNCNNSMEVSEKKCVECGSIFTYKDKNESKAI